MRKDYRSWRLQEQEGNSKVFEVEGKKESLKWLILALTTSTTDAVMDFDWGIND